MRYIQRDDSGKVIGHFANPQPYAQELVEDDHPGIVAFNTACEAARKRATPMELRLRAIEAKLDALAEHVREVTLTEDKLEDLKRRLLG